jgi:hypothetical protein
MRSIDRIRLRALPLSVLAVGLAVVLTCAEPVRGQEKAKEKARVKVEIDDKTREATKNALAWLAEQQNADGSWSAGRTGAYPNNTAITAYAMLAFMSQGHVPGQGKYGPNVARGARFLIAAQTEDGYIIGRAGNMYCHGMATLALSELWGMTGDDTLKPVVKKAVDLIRRSQWDYTRRDGEKAGGWRYEPRPSGADISVTIMQVMALRSAYNGGLDVPPEVVEKALNYVEDCFLLLEKNPNNAEKSVGGFTYQPGSGQTGFARTAAGVCILELFDNPNVADEKGKARRERRQLMIRQGINYLKDHEKYDRNNHYTFYGHYYAVHSLHLFAGQGETEEKRDESWKEWDRWYRTVRDTLLKVQLPNGSWDNRVMDPTSPGPVYQTSISVLVLSTPAHFLPIYQR